MDYIVLGKEYHNGFALSMTNPIFTADQFEALALFIATKAVEIAVKDHQASPTLMQLLQEAYVTKQDEVDKKLQQTLKENGLL